METIRTDTLIIGAGPAGLSCAMELSKAGKDFIVVEKSSKVGGLAKTYEFKEGDLTFYTDNGPHRFFSKNPYLYSFIEDLLGDDWIKVKRQTRQYIDGKFYDYPVNAVQAVKNIGFLGSVKMGIDYIWAKISYGFFKKDIKNFEDYAVANFGKTLADFNIINYTEKIWGIPAKEIHPDWATQRIKGLNLLSVVKNTIQKIFQGNSGNSPKSLIDEFYYPSKGTGLIYENIKNKIESKGYRVITECSPKKIYMEHSKITGVLLHTKDGEILIKCNNLVESVPITEFVKMIEPNASSNVLDSIRNLRHRSQVYLFITLDKESITNDQWIYFPNKKTPIARISEMKNFSSYMSPKGKTSLFVEFFCFENDEIWNMDKEQLLSLAMEQFEKANFFTKKDIRQTYIIKQPNVYPVYDLNYKENLSVIKDYLNSITNLYYIGRPGRFRYNNQDHSLEMGMLAAKAVIDGVKYDIESVGDEKEYYEKGSIPNTKSS